MRPHTGPSLPQSLLEELNPSADSAWKKKGHRSQLSRKDARKQDRQDRKQRKAVFFTSGRNHTAKRHAEEEHELSPQRKKQRIMDPQSQIERSSKSTVTAYEPSTIKPKKADKKVEKKTALEKLADRSASGTKPGLSRGSQIKRTYRTQQEQEEDANIAYLEAQLGWSKAGKRSGKYGKELEDDGLDELLKDLDTIETSAFSKVMGDDEDGDGRYEVSDRDVSSEEDEDMDEDSEEEKAEDHSEEWHGFGHDVDNASSEEDEDEEAPQLLEPVQDEKQASGTRYVPPHLRSQREDGKSAEKSEEQIKLTRQLKGLLNRMTEQNIGSIIDSIEEIYRNHRRHDVTSTLTTLIIDGISTHSILLDAYVVLHAAFVSALHKLVGVEFAAYFVQNVVASYERHFSAIEETAMPKEAALEAQEPSTEPVVEDTQGKECSNLIVLVSELYNFQVVSCVLVYDLIRGLLDGKLTEFKVELLLKITRNSGQQLRTDDPSALKDIIQIVHSKIPEQQNALSSRTRFMVETLTSLKNNKTKRNAAQLGSDAVDRMKKFLGGLNKKRHVMAHEPLRVTLKDLHSAESKGKWWLVGAAWGGDPLVDRKENKQDPKPDAEQQMSENVLLKLARKQGMNTDIRRSIFMVLMSSEDYVDACERLSQLKLAEVQQRDIIRVILHCCGNEKSYNPYYALIGQQLCRLSHNHKFTLQYCLWDFLRDLGETNVGGAEVIKNMKEDSATGFEVQNVSSTRMKNVARAYGWWIAKDCCTLAILKPLDFAILKSETRKFLVELFNHIFISTQLSTPLISSDPKDIPSTRNRGPIEEVFIQATRIQTLGLGLMYFLGEVYKREVQDAPGLLGWANKVALDTLRTGMDIVPTL